jgi:phage RecT family recombinase
MTASATQHRAQPGVNLTAPGEVRNMLTDNDARTLIQPLLPNGIAYDRVISEVYFAVQKNPEIAKCTPASIVQEVARAVSWDLVIGETVHLVPFNEKVARNPDRYEKRVKAIRDYKGDIELVVRSGAARSVDAKAVYKNETFEYEEGSEPRIRHVRILDPTARGPMIGAYAIARLPHYHIRIVWMALSEIDEIRQRHSKQWKEGPMPVWYALKTCVHQVTKLIPKNPRLAAVLAQFEQEDVEEEADAIVSTDGGAARAEAAPTEDAEFEVIDQQQEAKPAVASEPGAPATEAQTSRILQLTDNTIFSDGRGDRIREKLKKGLKSKVADSWIDMLVMEINNNTSAGAPEPEDDDQLPL